ncbi:MAG: DUF1553 domain-containing protein [Planctomycetota bacterium]|nr:MAG: DUF1553 domain-containing protein [Planctomycetota bacterium]REK47180.1 MAG: DUF1553 domain-containing protein [Planctomycetota bacterium]
MLLLPSLRRSLQSDQRRLAAALPVMCSLAVACLVFAAAAGPATAAELSSEGVDFSQVRRILSDRCFKCHGPDEQAREGDLRLDLRDEAEHVLTGETAADNELLRRILTDDADERMPPPAAKMTLSTEQIETLRSWIATGAPYQQHWAFVPVREVALPSVSPDARVENAIDRFILARVEQAGLEPAPRASRERLIRRLSFDLTGLPPTIEEIDAFLADRSPGAYERLVDRLLAKPAFGERMASEWLDVARYADSYGYQTDRERFVWPWRDWVIKAFNENMPLDQFITWQLAGDLLPDATDEQILATTFNRLHSQKVEGGSIPEEFRTEYVADRTHTFGTAFLGLTLECARCHEHKFDPVSQQEYYQLFAFFNNIDEAGLYSYHTRSIPTPTLLLTDDDQKARIAEVEQRIAAAEARLGELAAGREREFAAWLAEGAGEPNIPGRLAYLDFEEYQHPANKSIEGRVGRAVQLTGDDGIRVTAADAEGKLKDVGNFRRFEPFSLALWMNTTIPLDRAVVLHRSRSWTDAGSRGYQLLIEEGRLSASLIHFWPGNAMRIRTVEPLPLDQWHHVTITYDGSSRANGLRIYLDGQLAETTVVRDKLTKNITGGGNDFITIGERDRDRGFTQGKVDELMVYGRELTPLEVAQLHDGTALEQAVAAAAEVDPDGPRRADLKTYYLHTVDEAYREQLEVVRATRLERSKTVDGIREIMVMREMPQPRVTRRLLRGAYNAPGEPVAADTPAVLPPFPADAPRNRLGLARWLTDPSNPLTARVLVNRYWQLCFGEGLVRTPEDFGSQGEPPTHPELLDHLAAELVASDWDLKALLRKIVTSATYRQQSATTADVLAADPQNRLWARGPSYRLPAEMIRDNALAVSGLLVDQIGGAPVRPYEVAVSFKPVKRDEGAGLYRRSLYTFWKRTAPAPVMMSLDASRRDVCTVRRERTSSPLQVLVLLNDPQLVEAARLVGERMLRQHGADVKALVAETFRLLTSRRPDAAEQQILRQLYEEQHARFAAAPEQAEEFLATGDRPRDEGLDAAQLAAAGMLASAIMSYDESVTKR